MPSKVLFVDDRWREEHWKESFDQWLPESVEALYEEYGYKALQRLNENPDVKLVFLDVNFDNQAQQGEEVLNRINEKYPDLKVIILTSINDAQLALRLVHDQKKAYYYFYKDSLDPDQVNKTIQNAIESYDLRQEIIRKTDTGIIVGESPALKESLRLVDRASKVDFTVLITGESGSGKDLIARAIHLNSLRRKGAFIAVNCGAINEALIESELFGHVKGAFTNADRDKRGRFERADKGTIFLDEIAELKQDMQVRLLRVLESGELEKVGSEKSHRVDVRVLAATNQAIDDRVKQGLFREDLYYRINVLRIEVPPLRERAQDIPLLVNYFLQRLSNQLGTYKDISVEAIEMIKHYDWPGNVRALENVLKRAIVGSKSDTLDCDDFSDLIQFKKYRPSGTLLITTWVENVMSGKAGWNDIRREFGAAGDSRKKIIEGIILSLKQKLGHRPSGSQLADTLQVSRNNLNQLLNNLNLQLKDF